MDQEVNTKFDEIEEMLISMMESANLVPTHSRALDKFLGMDVAAHAGTHVLRNETMKPRDAFTFDMSSAETDEDHRLYTPSPEYLVRPAFETLDDGAEIVTFNAETGTLKWEGFRRRRTLPKGVMTTGTRPHAIYEHHFRMIGGETPDFYLKDLMAFNSKGNECRLLFANAHNDRNSLVFEAAVVAASMIEDAHRKDAFLASVHDGMTVRFPVGIGAHKDFFADRDAPMTPSGRRRAILHWVKKHQRRNAAAPTEAFTRGVKEITMDGIRVTLESF